MKKEDAVQIVLLNKKGEVLAVSRKHDHNDFGLIGGKVDEGENVVEAAIRETKEETGLDISNIGGPGIDIRGMILPNIEEK